MCTNTMRIREDCLREREAATFLCGMIKKCSEWPMFQGGVETAWNNPKASKITADLDSKGSSDVSSPNRV